MPIVSVNNSNLKVVVNPIPSPLVKVIGIQGAKGAKGDTSFISSYITRTAGTTISGQRAVIIRNNLVYYASTTDLSSAFAVTGISLNSALAGDMVEIVVYGEVEFSFWNWEVGKFVYVGQDGHLTQEAPTSGYVLIIARAISSTRLFVNIQTPILLL